MLYLAGCQPWARYDQHALTDLHFHLLIHACTVQLLSVKAVTCCITASCLQKYANHDLIKYLESIGAEFGACQNAYTSTDDTVYEFMVPTDDADLQILDCSFDVFAEFATKIRQGQWPQILIGSCRPCRPCCRTDDEGSLCLSASCVTVAGHLT